MDVFFETRCTYAASTNFKADKPQAILQKFLKEHNLYVPLPPEKPTVHCFENDTVNYLAQCKNKIPQTEDDQEDAQRNWKRSVRSTTEMIHYVRSLNPHSVTSIKNMYVAEQTIGIISKLMLEILMCISKDMTYFEGKKNEAEDLKKRILENPDYYAQRELKELLVIEETKVVLKALCYPNVVCEGKDCSKVVDGEIVYPRTCCENCSKSFMYWCDKMTWGSRCKVCNCDRSKHEWKTTKTEIITVRKYNESVIEQIVDRNTALQEINRAISECEERVKMYKDETEQMLRTCVKLNTFVCKTALMRHHDEWGESLQEKIETYERANANNAANATYLKRIREQYILFKEEESKTNNDYDVHKLIQQMYELPMKGNELKTAMEEEEKARQAAVEKGKKSTTVIDLGSQLYEQFKSKIGGLV